MSVKARVKYPPEQVVLSVDFATAGLIEDILATMHQSYGEEGGAPLTSAEDVKVEKVINGLRDCLNQLGSFVGDRWVSNYA